MTTDDRFDVLSALIDREPVDPDALAEALADPEGRARLVDFIRLRARVTADGASDEGPRFVVRDRSRMKTWSVRAALVLLPLVVGAAGGAWYVERMDSRPPTPDRVVQFVPGVDWK
jgi:hypothetical protein